MSTPQWVVFRLEAGQYALPLERVVEVLRLVTIRPVVEGPAWLAGVINLRGRVLPIMDLHTWLGLPRLAAALETRIIVAEVGGAASPQWLGLLADEVLEVITQTASAIELPAALAGGGRALQAVQAGDQLVSVFDLERLGADTHRLPQLEPGQP